MAIISKFFVNKKNNEMKFYALARMQFGSMGVNQTVYYKDLKGKTQLIKIDSLCIWQGSLPILVDFV